MGQYATAADLETLLGLTFDASDTTRANLLLELVSDEAQAYCTRVDFEQTVDDAVTLRGSWDRTLTLPGGPVASVSSVAIDGTTVTSFELVGDTLWRVPPVDGWDTSVPGRHWGGPDVAVAVTYTHGFTAVPSVVRTVCLRAAARLWANPEQRRSVQLEGYRADFGDGAAGAFLTGGDLATLRAAGYRRVRS